MQLLASDAAGLCHLEGWLHVTRFIYLWFCFDQYSSVEEPIIFHPQRQRNSHGLTKPHWDFSNYHHKQTS